VEKTEAGVKHTQRPVSSSAAALGLGSPRQTLFSRRKKQMKGDRWQRGRLHERMNRGFFFPKDLGDTWGLKENERSGKNSPEPRLKSNPFRRPVREQGEKVEHHTVRKRVTTELTL